MAIEKTTANGGAGEAKVGVLAPLDASKLILNLAKELKPVPDPEALTFGATQTDHMLIVNYDPINGWNAPEIKPYGPLVLDPMSSCFQYCPNVFEGMKAYIGPDGEPRLFRPDMNMARLAKSADRVALPGFDTSAALTLIKHLIQIEKRWIPAHPGYSLYLRPTIIGTRASLGVSASDSACLYVVVTPTGPYFRTTSTTKPKGISLLAVNESVRAWPGGTGGHKLGGNYAPGFAPQREAAKRGYDQVLWLIGENVTEVGAMNVFVIVRRDDGDLDAFTPPLDGTILPGLTRDSVLALLAAHTSHKPSTLPSPPYAPQPIFPSLPATLKIHTHERTITMTDLRSWSQQNRLLEIFGVGTAVAVAPVGKIGYDVWGEGNDLVLPVYGEEEVKSGGGLGPVGKAVFDTLMDIQMGKVEFEGWSVPVRE